MSNRRIVTMDSSKQRTRIAGRAATITFFFTAFAGTAMATPVLRSDIYDGGYDLSARCMLFGHSGRGDLDNGNRNACDSDFANDRFVNFIDLAMMRERFYTNEPDVALRGDDMVGFSDLAYLSPGFLRPGGPLQITPRDGRGIPVPAPTTSLLLLAGLLGWRTLRRPRA
jgi:hypothetical protein